MRLTTTHPRARKLLIAIWAEALIVVSILFVAFCLYNYLFTPLTGTPFFIEAIKAVCFVMIGWSNIISGVSYYFDFLDRHLGHRKIMGVMGFVFAWIYTFVFFLSDSDSNSASHLFTQETLLWILGMLILIIIVVVSNTSLQLRVGYKRHHWLLRMTYIAYALFLWREVIMQGDVWTAWLSDQSVGPPLSLLIAFFMCIVLLTRVSMTITEFFRKGRLI